MALWVMCKVENMRKFLVMSKGDFFGRFAKMNTCHILMSQKFSVYTAIIIYLVGF